MASMVFHLIAGRALERVAQGLAEVMALDARLLWNASVLGPAQPRTVLVHDPNRALRARWKELVRGRRAPANAPQRDAVAAAHDGHGAPIDDEPTRSRLIEELLRDDVLPAVHSGPAGTGDGHTVHWTLGDHRVRAR